jgi:hypothetical protein
MTKEQWDPPTPIIYLFSKIQDGVDKADAGNAPYTVNQVLAIAFSDVFRTGTMQSACERWIALALMNETWVNFQDMFISAHETYETLTSQSGGYHGANNVRAHEMEKFYNETAKAFANLAMAATADKDLLSTLTNTNSTLANQLATKDKISVALQEQLRSSRAPTMAPAHRQPSVSDKSKHYRWTNGVRVSSNHNSANCTNPGEGHKSDASRENKMGGGGA